MMRSSLTTWVEVQLLTLMEFTKFLPINRPSIYQDGARLTVPRLAWQRTVILLPTFSTTDDAGVIFIISVLFPIKIRKGLKLGSKPILSRFLQTLLRHRGVN